METKTETEPTILTLQEVAQLLRCSRKSVYNWVQRGHLPVTRMPGKLLFIREEVLDALRNRKTE